MKIKVNMYIRTDDGIVKVLSTDRYGFKADSNNYYMFDTPCILGVPNFNIIDLIEPQDLMYIDISPDSGDGIIVPRVAETLDELEQWKSKFADGSCILKGIVTHEQLESKTYWIDFAF